MPSMWNLNQPWLAPRALGGAALIWIVVSLISGGGAVVFGLAFYAFEVLRQRRERRKTPSC